MNRGFETEGGVLIKYHGSDKNVVIPDGITEIGSEAFSGCKKLVSVTMPESVSIIGDYAFSDCVDLIAVTIKGSIEDVGFHAFERCSSLVSITIPGEIDRIQQYAFTYCSNLTLLEIPGDARYIIDAIFYECPKVTVVCREDSFVQRYCSDRHIPFIFDYQYEAFNGTIPPGIEKLSSPFMADEETPYVFISYSHKDRDMVLGIIKDLYESGWKIWYDEGLTIGDKYDETLEDHVRNCSAFLLFVTDNSLNSLYVRENEIPWAVDFGKPIIKCITREGLDYETNGGEIIASVSPQEIEEALEEVVGLTQGSRRVAKGISIIANPADRDDSGGSGFAYCLYPEKDSATAQTILLEAKNSGCKLYNAAADGDDRDKLQSSACLIVFLDREFLSDRHLTDILIEQYLSGKDIAVCQLEDLDDSDLPEALTGLHLMQWLNYVHGITTDMNAKLVRHLQKRGCRDTAVLPSFKYKRTPSGIVINKYFGMETDLRIESEYEGLPVVEVGENAFKSCANLRTVVFSEGLEKIGESAFSDCRTLTSVTIPDSVTDIGRNAFENCEELVSVDISGAVKTISHGAFWNCRSLASVTIPDSVTRIEPFVFYGCESLTSADIPDSVREIGSGAFDGCKSLRSVRIPGGVFRISSKAFEDCESLTSVVLEDGVGEIGEYAFYGCKSLTSACIPKSVTDIEVWAFRDCPKLVVRCAPDSYAWEYCEDNDIGAQAPDKPSPRGFLSRLFNR